MMPYTKVQPSKGIALVVFLLILTNVTIHVFAAPPIELKSDLHKVNVYFVGAQLKFTSNVKLPKGNSTLYFTDVSRTILESTIQSQFNKGVKIAALSLEEDVMDEKVYFKHLQDSIVLLEDQLTLIDQDLDVLSVQKSILTRNISRLGEDGSVSVSHLMEATNSYKTKLKSINKEEFELNQQTRKLNEMVSKYEKELDRRTSVKKSTRKVIKMVVESPTSQSVQLDLSYMVNAAGWAPKYDLRAEDAKDKVLLEYKANVFNDCGLDWDNVELVLTTKNPTTKLERPQIAKAWMLDFRNPSSFNNEGNLSDMQLKESADIEYTKITIPQQKIFLEIEDKYSIPSENKPYLVKVKDYHLPVSFKHYAVPRLEDNVYLAANVRDWSGLNLIEGPSSIFYNSAYLGESYLDTRYSSDTLVVSLGVDSKVQITKVKKFDLESERLLGSNRHVNLVYDIDIRNNHNRPIEIQVEDQIPVAQDADIEIDLIEKSGAKHYERNGKLKWNLNLKPSQAKKLTVTFDVVMPKSQYRGTLLSAPSFGIGIFGGGVICPKFR